jgi:hypothetical protein
MSHKNPKLQTQILALSLLAIVLSALVSGCTKPRDAALPDAVESETFLISDLQGPVFQMQTSPQDIQSKDSTSKVAATNEKPKALVMAANVPSRMIALFQNRPVNAKLGASYPVTMKISDRKYVTVSKIVTDASELSILEKQLAKSEPQGLAVPLFKIPIKRIGILARVKNDLKEDTSQFELKETEAEVATHVQVDLMGSNAMDIGKDPANKKELEQVFIEAQIDKKVSTYEQLVQDLQLQTKENLSGKVYSLIDNNSESMGGSLLIYKVTTLGEIKDQDLLLKLKNGMGSSEIAKCSDSILQQLAPSERTDCVILLSHRVPISFVQAKMAVRDRNDIESPDIEIEERGTRSGLIKVVRHTLLSPVPIGIQQQLNPLNTIRVADIKNKEFLFRRTFEDGASTITAFGPGASGSLDIVKFEMEKSRLVVRKAIIVNGDHNSSDIDKEELVSIPVKYLKRIAKSDVIASVVETTLDQAEYVSLDWAQNTIPVANSPLAFFADGSCFQSTSSQTITDMDMRLSQGILNFSISGSYTFRPECMSFYGMNDYWYEGGLQANYNLKERVSFKLNTGENDKATNLEIPFRAQNLLGFGIFTMGQKNPDNFGNSGGVQSERALPVIQNFDNGRKFTYVLGGLPASGEIREALITSTRQVIADWNQALHRAFEGTPLARSGNYVDILVDGVDLPTGNLGDLDRNYIWNFEKNLDSGLLGMSQAAPNPRSGKIEQNNVLMYSGNLLSYIGAQKEISKIQREYQEMKDRVLKAAAPAPKAASSDPQSPIQSIISQAQPQKPMMSLILQPAGQVVSRAKNELMSQGMSSQDFEAQKRSALQDLNEKSYLQRILRKAVEMQAQNDESALDALTATEVLKAYGNSLSRDEKLLLSMQSRRLALLAEFEKNFRKGPACALAPHFSNAGDLEKIPVTEIFSKWYSSTLAHEIGHSLGLTHNFQGSFDKDNMKFANDKSDRNYSSIMDYIPDTHLRYAGPGPYDVHALRAIYTGKIELKDGSEISLTDFKKQVLGETSWWNMDASHLAQKPVKFYNFCTDVHVGGDPTCNRWDMGTSGEEVANWYADEYRNLYPVLNSIGNRINIRGVDRYISRVFYDFLALRAFVDETFYRAIAGYPDWQSFAKGAISALKVFTEVIATPDTKLGYADENRFEVIAGKDGQVLVEKKPSKDIMTLGFADRVETRGIELDKAIATMLLTSRGFGHPRYEAVSLRVSFAEFEKYVLGAESADEMVSLGLVKQIIEDNLGGLVITDKGIVNLPKSFKPEITEIMRYYAILGSTVFLAADTIEDKYDFSSVFRVGSSTSTAPKDRFLVTKLDQSVQSKTSLKLWAFDNANSAGSLVRSAAGKRVHIEGADATVVVLKSLLEADAGKNPEQIAKATKAVISRLEKLNTKSVLLSKEEIAAGESFASQVDLALLVMNAQIGLVGQIATAINSGNVDQGLVQKVLKDRRNMIESLAKSNPLVGIAEKALVGIFKADSTEAQILSEINGDQDLESNYGTVVSNLQTINRFVGILNPELNR